MHEEGCLGRLTPANDAEFENIPVDVSVKHFDKSNVHVDGLQPHPGEGRQEEEVQ